MLYYTGVGNLTSEIGIAWGLTMKKLSVLIILISAGFIAQCGGKSETRDQVSSNIKAFVSNVTGDVRMERAGTEEALTQGFVLLPSDAIITGAGAAVELAVKDYGVIKVGPDSRVVVQSLVPGSGDSASKAEFSLQRGDMAAVVKKKSARAEFNVVTPTAIAGVRGTAFGVSVKGGTTHISVLEGAVGVKQAGQDLEVILEKNSQLVIQGQQKLSRDMVRPLSPEALEKIKGMTVFHKSNVLEFNTLVEEVQQNSAALQVLEGDADLEGSLADRDRRSAEKDTVAKARRADISKTLKRDTRQDPIKLEPDSSYKDR